MDAHFYRAQAALCHRIGQRFPQERIAKELIELALEFEMRATELERPQLAPWIAALD
jgi:hypothetical protein